MTTKNALLFCCAVFGIIFIGAGALFGMLGLGEYITALSAVGGLMLVVFVALVLGFGFLLKLAYLGITVGVVSYAADAFAKSDFVMGAIFAVAACILLGLIPMVFLKKK